MFRRASLQPLYLASALIVLAPHPAAAQELPPPSGGDFAQLPADVPPAALPTGVILVKGAEPAASDSSTPVPEDGGASRNVYRNRYFGITWTLPDGWSESFKGPPPSDSGFYVLSNVVPSSLDGPNKGTVLFSAQDIFFGRLPLRDTKDLVAYRHDHLESFYKSERAPAEVTIAGHSFVRFDYGSPVAGLHWVVLATPIRCHAVQFVLSSRSSELLEGLIRELDERMTIADADFPLCVPDYVADANVITRVDPVLTDRKMNAIPVRMIIDKKGRVEHVHVLSAFPEQSEKIIKALLQWTFKPYERDGTAREVETGVTFGYVPRVNLAATSSHTD